MEQLITIQQTKNLRISIVLFLGHSFFEILSVCVILQVDGQTEYSRCQGYALHLAGPARCGVL